MSIIIYFLKQNRHHALTDPIFEIEIEIELEFDT